VAIYRVLRNLIVNEERILRGSLSDLAQVSEQGRLKLLKMGRITRIEAPPLDVFPGWQFRAKRFAKLDILNAEDLLEADESISEQLRIKPDTLERWKGEVRELMQAPPPPQG